MNKPNWIQWARALQAISQTGLHFTEGLYDRERYQQVGKIARFIASIDARIPYALLAFAPNFYMADLPCTTPSHAREAEGAARAAGLENVRLGNRHLLGLGWIGSGEVYGIL